MPRLPQDGRVKEVVVGSLIIFCIAATICLFWVGRMIPGIFGEWIAMIVGIATSPFLMEATFIFIGLTAVFAINSWRHHKEGDELVYLEQAEGPGSEELPDQARWAIYRDEPLLPAAPDLMTEAEGALAIGEHRSAAEAIAAMSAESQASPAGLALRIQLARATGKTELATELESRLAALRSENAH